MNKFYRILFSLALMVATVSPAEAAKRTIRLGFFEYAGCHQLSPDGTRSGYGYEFITRLAKYADWNLEFVGYDKTCADMLPMLDRGEIDLVDFVIDTPERRERYGFSKQPMAYSGISLRTSVDRRGHYRLLGISSWPKVKVGVLKCDVSVLKFREYADDHHLEYEIVGYDSEKLAAEACRRGEVDIVAFDSFAPAFGLTVIGDIAPVRNHLVVRKADAALLAEIDKAMDALTTAEPVWMASIRGKYYPTSEVSAYFPEHIDEHTVRYLRRVLARISDICGWDITIKPCDGSFSDAVFKANSIGCGVYLYSPNVPLFQLPRQSAGRRRADLLARPEDRRFDEGVKDLGLPYRVGYLKSEKVGLKLFYDYVDENVFSYVLAPTETVAELEDGLESGLFDLIIRPSSPGSRFKSVASCGHAEFFIAPQSGNVAMAHMIDDVLNFMYLDDPEFFLSMEREFFASSDDDGRNVRIGAFVERGICERDANGEWIGLVPDFVRKVALHAGWNVTFIPMSFTEADRAFANGKVDLVGVVTRDQRRKPYVEYSNTTVGPLTYSLMARKDGKLRPNVPDNWQGARIGVLWGSDSAVELERRLQEYGVAWYPSRYHDLVQAEEDLRRGNLDAVLTLPNYGNRDFVSLVSIPIDLCYFAASSAKPWIRRELDAKVGEFLRKDGDWMRKLVSRNLRVDRNAISLTGSELEFVRANRAHRFTVSFDAALPPLVVVDPSGKVVDGFFRLYFGMISARSGLRFELLPPGSDADIVISFLGAPKPDPTKGVNYEWLRGPACWVKRRSPDGRGSGIVAVIAGDATASGVVRGLGYRELTCETREQAYEAVSDGVAEQLFDRLGVARYLLDEKGEFPDLSVQSIDTDVVAYPVAIQKSAELDSRLRTILDKARDTISPGDFNTMIFEAIYGIRALTVDARTLVLLLLAVILVAGAVVFCILHKARVAQAATDAKTAFLNSMSHDIRTPMNAILGFVNMARSSLKDEKRVQSCLDKIDIAGTHLLQLINEVLDISRVESGTVEIKPVPFDVVRYLDTLGVLFSGTAAKKGVSFSVDSSGVRDRCVMCDEKRIDQIVLNIVGNAVKYTREGSVTVVCREGEVKDGAASYFLTVEDTGVGMSKEFLRRIYEPFARDSAVKASGVEGTGLGMAIVRKMVDICGGTIDITSELGRGTKVTLEFVFPVCDMDIDEAEAAIVSSSREKRTLSLRRVLLVEDNELNREIARFVLESMNLIVDEVVNGAEAVTKLRDSSPGYYSWVLMDIQMPVMNGYEATREIRTFNADIPIIAMTANAFAEDRAAALDAGMNEHVAKPIKADVLKAVLMKFI